MPTHPTPWIPRTLEAALRGPTPALELFPVWMVLGPRQVGKSSLLLRCAESARRYVNLDDLATRARATADLVGFARDLRPPLLIDEIQYAPGLLSAVKVIADRRVAPGAVWITGSQSFDVMRGVRESLAGRVALLRLNGLADEERPTPPITAHDHLRVMLATRFPALAGVTDGRSRALYLSSYVQTYIDRDVSELLGIQKRREFERFVTLCALRTGQLVNYDDLGRDAGVSAATAKDWLGVLADTFLVTLVPPWHSSRSKRLIKASKLYFLDVGLAAYLSGWRTIEQIRSGEHVGALFESHVLGCILAALHHRVLDARVYFWRDRDGREIDFLIEMEEAVIPIEVKVGAPGAVPRLGPVRETGWTDGWVVTPTQRAGATTAHGGEWTSISPRDLTTLAMGL